MLGWMADSLDSEDLRFLHLRPQGSSHIGIWAGRVRAGFGQYFMGTSPIYLLAAALYRVPQYPVLIGSIATVWGYFSSGFRGVARYDDSDFRQFLRRYQRDCLIFGKREATRRTDERQEPVWNATHLEAGALTDQAAS
jgi:hypothetical protein